MFVNITYIFKCVQILIMSNVLHETFKWWNTYSFAQFQLLNTNNYLYLDKLANPTKKNFRKAKMTIVFYK